MPGMPPPEGERHSHDYRLDVVVRRDDSTTAAWSWTSTCWTGAAERRRAGRGRGPGDGRPGRGRDGRGVRPLGARPARGRARPAARCVARRPGLGVTGRLRRLHVGPVSPAGRRLARAVVGPMPVPVADAPPGLAPGARTSVPARIRRALLRRLFRGGIPVRCRVSAWSTTRTSSSSRSTPRSSSSSTGAASRAGSPELLPWWRAFCRTPGSVLELGTNVGYFAVQGGRAPGRPLRRRRAASRVRRGLPDAPRPQRRDLRGADPGRGGRLLGVAGPPAVRPTRRPPRRSRSSPWTPSCRRT